MKVLVVEDHRALRGLLADHLVQAGFAVDAAEDGRTAQALLEVGSYDAMILDLGLPDMDGMALLEKRRDTANADIVPANTRPGVWTKHPARRRR